MNQPKGVQEFNWQLLDSHIASGLIRAQTHPELPLTIYNYSPEVQAERLWDDVTLQCRGLVCCGQEIVGRPFRKFFNDTEHEPDAIPWHLPCEITEKLDGSLLIWFCFQGQWIACTRGSFTSKQSEIGRSLLLSQYPDFHFDPKRTYLFEVIYPENRIVVNYGTAKKVVLIAVYDTATGEEVGVPDGIEAVRRLGASVPPQKVRSLIRDDEEGYVLRFSNGFRVKVKGERYIYLHKIISGISSRMVWENLSQGRSFTEVLEVIPDECVQWVNDWRGTLQRQYETIDTDSREVLNYVQTLSTRKEQALVLLSQYKELAPVVFAKLDKKDHARVIWKMIYPEYERPGILSE